MQKITISNLSKKFTQGIVTVTVLDDITASFDAGITVITGMSGSGKSTLLHLIAGLDTPDTGLVSTVQDAGLLLQSPHLIAELSLLENVMLKGLIQGLPYEQCELEARELVSQVGLTEKLGERVTALSGGQQQRVALARALFGSPSWIFADEPTGNLDRPTGKSMIDLLVQMVRTRSMGAIVVSHDPYVEQIADQKFELKNGKLIAHATTRKTTSNTTS